MKLAPVAVLVLGASLASDNASCETADEAVSRSMAKLEAQAAAIRQKYRPMFLANQESANSITLTNSLSDINLVLNRNSEFSAAADICQEKSLSNKIRISTEDYLTATGALAPHKIRAGMRLFDEKAEASASRLAGMSSGSQECTDWMAEAKKALRNTDAFILKN